VGSSGRGDRHVPHYEAAIALVWSRVPTSFYAQVRSPPHRRHPLPTHSSWRGFATSGGPHPNPPLAKVRGPEVSWNLRQITMSVKNLLL